jgi:predicted NUDIX family NTP pyrophosphohydrolase
MPRQSAGLLPYRYAEGGIEVLIAHPGGPLWARRDDAAWSVAKGEFEAGEDAEAAAEREFLEELGFPAPPGERLDLGELRQPSGKRVRVWALHAPDLDPAKVRSNSFEMQWPPRSGRRESFPEIDRAEWVSPDVARRKLVKGQVAFVDRLLELLPPPSVGS